MIAMYEFNSLTIEKTNRLLKEIGAKKRNEKLTVSDIYNHGQEKYSNIKESKIGFKN